MGEPRNVINGVIIHLENELPIMVDLEQLPGPADMLVRCTNVRTVDGKRPQFVREKDSTFFFPVSIIRLIEAPATSASTAVALQDEADALDERDDPLASEAFDDAEEHFLARIRQI
ncbi:MAG TPA: hypothetical protein VIK08_03380 [Candidatus Limnocylindrales bacterium]